MNNQKQQIKKTSKKDPNYRESQTTDFSKALNAITTTLDTCIVAVALKTIPPQNVNRGRGKRKPR